MNTAITLPHWDGQAQNTQVTIGNVKGKKFPWQQRERLWYLWAQSDEDRNAAWIYVWVHRLVNRASIKMPVVNDETFKPVDLTLASLLFICSFMPPFMLKNGKTLVCAVNTMSCWGLHHCHFICSASKPFLSPHFISNNHELFKYLYKKRCCCVASVLHVHPQHTLTHIPVDTVCSFFFFQTRLIIMLPNSNWFKHWCLL